MKYAFFIECSTTNHKKQFAFTVYKHFCIKPIGTRMSKLFVNMFVIYVTIIRVTCLSFAIIFHRHNS